MYSRRDRLSWLGTCACTAREWPSRGLCFRLEPRRGVLREPTHCILTSEETIGQDRGSDGAESRLIGSEYVAEKPDALKADISEMYCVSPSTYRRLAHSRGIGF